MSENEFVLISRWRIVIPIVAKNNRRLRLRTKVALSLLLALGLTAVGFHLWAWQQFREGERLARHGRFVEAYAHYAQALKVWRWSPAAHFTTAQTARRAGLYAEAERCLESCRKLQGSTADPSLPLAVEHLLLQAETGDIAEVEGPLWQYVEKNKEDAPLILEGMARAYSRLLRLGEAMRCLRLLRERQPDNIEALLLTAEVIQQGGGEIDKAGADYRRALELDPQRDDARLKLAQLLVRDHYREAREHFEYLLARKPDDEEVILGLALAQRALGDSEGKARPLLEAVLAHAPDNSKALSELGAMELADGHTQEAEALLRRAVASNPTNHLAHLRLYYCLTRQADKASEAAEQIARYERVKADLERFGQIVSKELMRKPKDANLLSEIGKFYLTYGKPQAGLRWLYRALQLDPTHRTSHRLLYEYYKQQGDLERAEAHRTHTHTR